MWVIGAAALGVLVVVLVRAFSDDAEIVRDWENALSPWGLDSYRQLRERVEGDSRMIEYAFQRAFSAREGQSPEEAIRLLQVGLGIVERTSPQMMTLLRDMSVASRMAAAISPVGKLRPGDFRLPPLASLTVLATVGDYLVFSDSARFRLRAFLLQKGFGLVRRFLLNSTERLRSRRIAEGPDWDRIAAARADLQTLSAASLQTFHALLVSLNPLPR